MKCLLLGGSGFLGSHVTDRLMAAGHEVCIFDLATERFRRRPPDVEFVSGDLRNVSSLDQLLSRKFDVVLHFVTTTTPKSSNESPEFDIQSNVVATVELLRLCLKHEVPRFIYLSSGGTVYGDIGNAARVDETFPTNPICSYGISKLTVERFLHMYQRLNGLSYAALRVSNPYGERQSPQLSQGALAVFLYRVMNNMEVDVWGDGSVVRDFIYAGDVADAVLAALPPQINGIYNVGSDIGVSVIDLLRQIGEIVGKEPIIRWSPSRQYDVPRIVLDSSRFARATGWQCCVGLRQGLMKTSAWIAQRNFNESTKPTVIPISKLERHNR